MFRWIFFIFLSFCATLLWLRMWHILVTTIWKSWHWRVGISIDTTKFYIFLTKIRKKKTKQFWLIQLLCSFIWHKWHFATITHLTAILFFSAIYPEESIGSLVRKVWIFGAPIHQHFEKIFAKKIFGNFSVKHPFCSPKFKQKTCKRKRAQETLGVYRSAQVRSHASYDKVWISYTLFLDQRHICGSMEMKNIRRFHQISYVVNKLMRLIVSILVFTLIFHCLIS